MKAFVNLLVLKEGYASPDAMREAVVAVVRNAGFEVKWSRSSEAQDRDKQSGEKKSETDQECPW